MEPLHPFGPERFRIPKLITMGEGETKPPPLPKAVQEVHHAAAPRLVGLQEHQVGAGPAGGLWGCRAAGGEGGEWGQ